MTPFARVTQISESDLCGVSGNQRHSYGRGAGVERRLGVGADLGVGVGLGVGVTVAEGVAVAVIVGVAVGVGVGVGVAVDVGVGVGAPDFAQYLPPVLRLLPLSSPPQTIISLPLQIAVCSSRALGAFVVLVTVQPSVLGLYLPPVFT